MPTVKPEQALSREFLIHLSRGDLMSSYLWREIADIAARYPDEDDADDMSNAMNRRLHELAYSTNLDTAFGEFDAGIREDLGFWVGRYALFDEAGVSYELHVAGDGACVVLPSGTATEHTYSDGILHVSGDDYAFELRMTLPLTDTQMDHPEFDITAPTTPGQPLCEGTVSLTVGGQRETRRVRGKRNCYSREGVERALDGDPGFHWAGAYRLTYTDQEPWTTTDDALTISDSGESMTVLLGARPGIEVRFANNALECRFDVNGETWLAGYFAEAPTGKVRRFFGLLQAGGQIRTVTGYWIQSASQAVTHHPMRISAMPLADQTRVAASNDPPVTARAFTIDLTDQLTVKFDATTNERIYVATDDVVLPKGVERNDYAVILNFKGLPSPLESTGLWRMVEASVTAQLFIRLRRDSTLRPWLDASMGETQSAGFHSFTLVQEVAANTPTGNLKTTIRIPMELEGVSRDPIEISPTELPPIIIGRQYNAGVTALGGEPPLTWATTTSPLPSDSSGSILFTPTTQKFSGKICDMDLSLRVFPVELTVAADERVVMKPGVAAINLRVEPEISSVDAKNLAAVRDSTNAAIVVGVLGGLVGIGVPLVQFVRRKLKTKGLYAAATQAIKAVHDLKIPTKGDLYDAVVSAYKKQTGRETSFKEAKEALETLRQKILVVNDERSKALSKVEKSLDRGGLDAEQTRKLTEEKDRLTREIKEAQLRLKEARATETRIESAEHGRFWSDEAFEEHIRGRRAD